MDRGGCLRNILVAVVSVVERSMSPVLVTTACKVVWKLAKSVGEHHLRPRDPLGVHGV